jgi:hypothetical protein
LERVGVIGWEAGILLAYFRKTPMRTGLSSVNLAASAIWRFRLLSLAFVYSRLSSSFASAMTLTMTLAAKNLPVFLL